MIINMKQSKPIKVNPGEVIKFGSMNETIEQKIRGALARAYTHDSNTNKVLDSDLIIAAEEELLAVIRPLIRE
jgi:hypothetical protein